MSLPVPPPPFDVAENLHASHKPAAAAAAGQWSVGGRVLRNRRAIRSAAAAQLCSQLPAPGSAQRKKNTVSKILSPPL